MGRFSSILKSPKKEEQQVPDNSVPESSETNDIYLSLNTVDEIDIMDELEDIWGIEDEKKLVGDGSTMSLLETDILDLDEFQMGEVDYKKMNITSQLLQEEEQMVTNVAKREISGFLDDDEENLSVNLNLSLNYQEVMDAWSDRGSLWADECSLSAINNFMGEVPVMQEERTRREASVMRYKEKRQSRLFSNSKKIRYQVRKINAENRPRLKGRFVKSVQDKMHI